MSLTSANKEKNKEDINKLCKLYEKVDTLPTDWQKQADEDNQNEENFSGGVTDREKEKEDYDIGWADADMLDRM